MFLDVVDGGNSVFEHKHMQIAIHKGKNNSHLSDSLPHLKISHKILRKTGLQKGKTDHSALGLLWATVENKDTNKCSLNAKAQPNKKFKLCAIHF